jgi:hypothetical protein
MKSHHNIANIEKVEIVFTDSVGYYSEKCGTDSFLGLSLLEFLTACTVERRIGVISEIGS